jgi:exoribonuclease R
MVHRLLQFYLDGGKSSEKSMKLNVYSSTMEGLAKAERDSIKYMQVKYMQDHRSRIFGSFWCY